MKGSVLVAMSGGVDSAATAYLLQQAGYEVSGAHIKVINEKIVGSAGSKSCCSLSDQVAARQTCAQLGILFHVFNWENEFREKVYNYFIAEYLKGRTPNPCILCNQEIKFGLLLARAREMGFDWIATGHYVRKEVLPDGSWRLLRGVDPVKDQSYVLSCLNAEQLSAALFPVGGYTKPEIRQLMAKAGLIVAEKPESQEICFIPDNDYRGFLKREAPRVVAPGPIKDTSGKILGRHNGVAFYTIGQRKGLNIAVGHPLYVKRIDMATRSVIVARDEEVFSSVLSAHDPLWLIDLKDNEMDVKVQIRHRHQAAAAKLRILPAGVEVEFERAQRGVTPGQRVAFYREEQLIGGAWID